MTGINQIIILPRLAESKNFLMNLLSMNQMHLMVMLLTQVGGDQNHPMSYPTAISNLNLNGGGITTIDIREDSLAEIKNNYLSVELPIKPKIIISNPPFNLSEEIIEKSLNDVEDGGFVVMLLRLNFFEGKKRKEGFWRRVGLPKYSFVHHRRMSFTDDGKTDSVAYQHIVFQKGYNPEFTLLKVI